MVKDGLFYSDVLAPALLKYNILTASEKQQKFWSIDAVNKVVQRFGLPHNLLPVTAGAFRGVLYPGSIEMNASDLKALIGLLLRTRADAPIFLGRLADERKKVELIPIERNAQRILREYPTFRHKRQTGMVSAITSPNLSQLKIKSKLIRSLGYPMLRYCEIKIHNAVAIDEGAWIKHFGLSQYGAISMGMQY